MLLLLLFVYVFNFIDRQIIGVLAVPIKAELGLSDRQLGLMGGVAFALFYSTLALPIAWLADRRSRVAIISISVAIWSLFTAACGLAQGFWQLFLTRMGVGIGEAGGVAPSYALISDYFPVSQRSRALAFFSLGIPIGSALGIFFGGWIASHLDWRAAFYCVGLAGLAGAPALLLFVPEPRRGAAEEHATEVGPVPPFTQMVRTFGSKFSFWLLAFGSASGSILGYGLIFWLPALFTRSFGLSLGEIAWYYGSIVLVGGVAGTWLGGMAGDRLGPGRPAAYALIPAVCLLVAAVAYALAFSGATLPMAWILLVVGQTLGLTWLGPVLGAVQLLVPPSMRATTSASFLLINNLIGIGFGVWIFGEISTRVEAAYGNESLRYAVIYGLAFYVLAAGFYFLAAPRLKKDVAVS